jgi:hypothetical protein
VLATRRRHQKWGGLFSQQLLSVVMSAVQRVKQGFTSFASTLARLIDDGKF